VAGKGEVGAVLIHEYPGPMCGWWPYAAYLARHGVRALLFDLRCFGDSACPDGAAGTRPVSDVEGAVRALRSRGARRVVLVGASLGGTISVVAGASLHPPPAGVVDLSGEADLSGLLSEDSDLNAAAAAPGLRAPSLFVVARGDRYTPVVDMRRVYRRTGSVWKRMIVEPAAFGHGWVMVDRAALARLVLAFIRAPR
jgi:dienelactone hydrolase